MEVEWIQKEELAQKADPGEKSPAIPARIQTDDLSITSLALNHLADLPPT